MIAPFVDPWQEDEDNFPPDDLMPMLTALLVMLIGAAILMLGLISSMKHKEKHVERPKAGISSTQNR
jgi:hypothetical protein